MLRTIDLRRTRPTANELLALVPRAATDVTAALDAARALIGDVRERGEAALRDQAERFDGVRPAAVRVPAAELDEALDALAPAVRSALEAAIARVRTASAAQVPAPERTELDDGAVVEQRWQPVGRVGLYVPGGKAVYPSSVVMNVVPAQVAGVPSIALASPPQARRTADGSTPTILAAAAPARRRGGLRDGRRGRDRRLRLRRAGPRARARRRRHRPRQRLRRGGEARSCRASSGIDAEAGPTEILVIADDSRRRRLRRGRPRQPGRARRARGSRARHRLGRVRRPRCANASPSASRRRSTPSASASAVSGRQSADRARRRPRAGRRLQQRVRARAPRAPAAPTPTPCSRASRTPARSSSARTRR